MSKRKELEAALKELRKNAKSVLDIADAIEKEYLSGQEETNTTAETEAAKPKSEPVISLSEIKAVLMEKSKAGYDAEVHALIKSYNVPKLSAIDKVHYPELMEKAKVIGNA